MAGKQTVDVVLLGYGQIGRTLGDLIARRKNGNGASVRVVGVVDRSGFVFDAHGLKSPQAGASCRPGRRAGKPFAQAPSGQSAAPAEAVSFFARHALARPVLVDVTAEETGPVLVSALQAGMDVVLANKRPLSGARAERGPPAGGGRGARPPGALRGHRGRRACPSWTPTASWSDSGDKVQKIEGCVSGTLGFLFTELGRRQAVLEGAAGGGGQGLHRARFRATTCPAPTWPARR